MISREQARERVLARIREAGGEDELVILDEETIEREWGWVFFCTTRSFLESGDPDRMPIGNAPYIVNRETGAVHETGTADSIEAYLEDYEDQLERAYQKWTLHVEEPPTAETIQRLRPILNVKRSEVAELRSRLPGAVRRGARRDLEPFCQALRSAGVRADVRPSRPGSGKHHDSGGG